MLISQLLLDDRIDDNTSVVITDKFGGMLACGRWYQDKILLWGSFHATLYFVEGRNLAILQLR